MQTVTVKDYLEVKNLIKLIDLASLETKGRFFRNSLAFVREHEKKDYLTLSHAQIGWLDKIKRAVA